MTFRQFEVVRVPFPFTDITASKRRPALVLSDFSEFGDKCAHSVLAMITSRGGWPLDVPITDLSSAGLSSPSVVRFKLFTLDHRLILGSLGMLSANDGDTVAAASRRLFGFV